MRLVFTLLFWICSCPGLANMASPYTDGDWAAAPFSSRDIDILMEKISIRFSPEREKAFYDITYNIRCDASGRQIPLLFYAPGYEKDFLIWVDGQPVKTLDIPVKYARHSDIVLPAFKNSFSSSLITVCWDKNVQEDIEEKDLLYFETNLNKGDHTIKVTYTASTWTNRSDWVKTYASRYALGPARNWRSFGQLEISLHIDRAGSSFTTDLESAAHSVSDSLIIWKFDSIPQSCFQILFTPGMSIITERMVVFGPGGFAGIAAFLLVGLHMLTLFRYPGIRKLLFWPGILLIPFLILLVYVMSYDVIDTNIGAAASQYHGYPFLVFFLYPIIIPIYWIIVKLIPDSNTT